MVLLKEDFLANGPFFFGSEKTRRGIVLVSLTRGAGHDSFRSMTPWDRLPGETDAAFAAFGEYLRLGISGEKRSLVRIAEKNSVSYGAVVSWNRDNRWPERARAYDSHVAGKKLEVDEELGLELHKRHRILTGKMYDVANLELEKLLERAQTKGQALEPRSLRMFVETIVKLERLSAGESTENVVQNKESDYDFSKLSLEDLLTLRRLRDSAKK